MKKIKVKVKKNPNEFFDNYENFAKAFEMVETDKSCEYVDCDSCAFHMGKFGCALPKIRGILSKCAGSEFYKSNSSRGNSIEEIIEALGGKC